jgi:transcriptional regulator with XRE-family HTH domain
MFRGDRMRSARQSLGLSQDELARAIEERESMVGMWERGGHQPRTIAVAKIARHLGVSADYLLDLTDEPSAPGRRAG